MRIVTYGGAVSLDGFLAGVDGSIDWLHYSKDAQQLMTDYWKDIDTILMGRKTYVFAVANTPKKSEPRKNKIPGTRTYVFSRTLQNYRRPQHRTRERQRCRLCPNPQGSSRKRHLPDGRW